MFWFATGKGPVHSLEEGFGLALLSAQWTLVRALFVVSAILFVLPCMTCGLLSSMGVLQVLIPET